MSGVYLLGMHTNVAHFGATRFWAKDGIIHVECGITNTYGTITVDEALRRVQAVRQIIGTSTNPGLEIDICERESMMRSVEQMLNVIRMAKEQGGGPSNPEAVKDSEMRRKKMFTVAVPWNLDFKR